MNPAALLAAQVAASSTAPKVDYWALQKVNREVNTGPYHDCEWFTHFKQQKLKEMGISSEKLYVSTEHGDGTKPNHVVITVGDWVLDNRQHRVMTRKQMLSGGYKPFPGYEIPTGK